MDGGVDLEGLHVFLHIFLAKLRVERSVGLDEFGHRNVWDLEFLRHDEDIVEESHVAAERCMAFEVDCAGIGFEQAADEIE